MPSMRTPRIALTWLVRLRWLAVAGQLAAVVAAAVLLGVSVPWSPVLAVAAVTLGTNLALVLDTRYSDAPAKWLVPGTLVLDVLLLTVLLYLFGGARNPFAILYVVHVAMAAAVMQSAWRWLVVAVAVASYSLLFLFEPQSMGLYDDTGRGVLMAGQWLSLVLVSVLISYFIGRVTAALVGREAELARMREQAARAEQITALATLAAGAAHELGTPLGTIAVVAKELEREIDKLKVDDPNLVEDAKLIRAECDRCRRILDRMRVDVAVDADPAAATVSLPLLLKHTREDLKRNEPDRLDVHQQAPDTRHVTSALAVRQSLNVLIRNAFDASPVDGRVALHVDDVTLPHGEQGVMFRVIDQGEGMPEEVLRRAGDPFFTTKSPGRGMGLGLFLVRLVAERAGGVFQLQSQPGAGTTATFAVPAITRDTTPQENHADDRAKYATAP